jgi:D-serine dehydratase
MSMRETHVSSVRETRAPAENIAPAEIIDLSGKGLGAAPEDTPLAEVSRLNWNLLREDLSLPVAVLSQEAMEHNLRWMQQFIAAYHVQLAPHGKTTMCPALFRRQLDAGAWGITIATASQARAAYRHGVYRLLMANQLVGARNMSIVSEMLRDPRVEFYSLVDSVDGVEQLGRFFREKNHEKNRETNRETTQQVRVLLELGELGGRTGVRDRQQEDDVLAAVSRYQDAVMLAGVEVYEGVLPDEAAIRKYLKRAVATVERLARDGHFSSSLQQIVLTGAGSAWFDVVAEEFSPDAIASALPALQPPPSPLPSQTQTPSRLEVVLRPGCYLTHDVGAYRDAQQRMTAENAVVRRLGDGLRPALQVWAYVQSRPEPELAIIGLGKRDVAFDAGLPVPALQYRPADNAVAPSLTPKEWTVTKIMDQHAYMKVPADADVRVGDMLAFDISHPCLTWDKWRQVPIIDRDYRVIELVQTYF